MKIVTVVGARPQFIKAAALSRCIKQNYADRIDEVLVHTGQHYDQNLSDTFFADLFIPKPKYQLSVIAKKQGEMTGRMLEAIETVLLEEKPDCVLVYGDTNSTLAGALAASKLHIPIAHVEAGLRSFNMRMPEEINRILTDRISSYLLCPTEDSIKNLKNEGLTGGLYYVGDVMYDNALYFSQQAPKRSEILDKLKLKKSNFILMTCHRAENTDNAENLRCLLEAVREIASRIPVVFPIHPRTRSSINQYELNAYLKELVVLDPLPYFDMVQLQQSAKAILTDSGGVQKEAFFYGIPCITLREETEWVETVELGWNQVVGVNYKKILSAVDRIQPGSKTTMPYGEGDAAKKILQAILENSTVM